MPGRGVSQFVSQVVGAAMDRAEQMEHAMQYGQMLLNRAALQEEIDEEDNPFVFIPSRNYR